MCVCVRRRNLELLKCPFPVEQTNSININLQMKNEEVCPVGRSTSMVLVVVLNGNRIKVTKRLSSRTRDKRKKNDD